MARFTERPFPRLFEDQAAEQPDRPAVLCGHETLTFGELNARANQLARHLRALGVRPESLVGICIDRSLEMAIGILGILKAGGAYLPLDPEYPTERLAFMLGDAQPTLVLTKSSLEKRLPREFQSQDHPPLPLGEGNEPRVVMLDQDWPRISRESRENLSDGPSPDDLAYVIYTSGSTGRPKGVQITHRNVGQLFDGVQSKFGFGAEDVWTLFHSTAFDFSVSEPTPRRFIADPLLFGIVAQLHGTIVLG